MIDTDRTLGPLDCPYLHRACVAASFYLASAKAELASVWMSSAGLELLGRAWRLGILFTDIDELAN